MRNIIDSPCYPAPRRRNLMDTAGLPAFKGHERATCPLKIIRIGGQPKNPAVKNGRKKKSARQGAEADGVKQTNASNPPIERIISYPAENGNTFFFMEQIETISIFDTTVWVDILLIIRFPSQFW